MKAARMKERPVFDLMKQNDVQNVYYMQMPRWLFSDPRYAAMSLDAKVTYTFLLNRFQLSRMNGWMNERGEVFVIFPRKALAQELRICEQRVTAAFRKLVEVGLVWEKRCGLGRANQIYLAKVTPRNDSGYSCAPFMDRSEDSETGCRYTEDVEMRADAESFDEDTASVEAGSDTDPADARTEETAVPQSNEHTVGDVDTLGSEKLMEPADTQIHNPAVTHETPAVLGECGISENAVPASEKCVQSLHGVPAPNREPQYMSSKGGGFGDFRTAVFEVQEALNLRPNKKDISQNEKRENKISQSVSPAPRVSAQVSGKHAAPVQSGEAVQPNRSEPPGQM